MQVPAQVEYERAASVEHALELLARYGPEARILAGGHSLIPMMKLGVSAVPPASAALRATMVIRGRDGTRTVPAREFHTGPYETVVAPAEILTEIRMAIRPGGGGAYEKGGRRGRGAGRRRGRAVGCRDAGT